MKVAADPEGGLLVQGSVQGAQLRIQSLPGWEDTPWSEGESGFNLLIQQASLA
jgi:hypothetical protein